MAELYREKPHTSEQLEKILASSFMTEAGAGEARKTLEKLI